MLIKFTEQKGVPVWWGYALAFLMFFTAILQTLILHRHFQYCFVTGMNVRTALIGAIYRKVREQSSQHSVLPAVTVHTHKCTNSKTFQVNYLNSEEMQYAFFPSLSFSLW